MRMSCVRLERPLFALTPKGPSRCFPSRVRVLIATKLEFRISTVFADGSASKMAGGPDAGPWMVIQEDAVPLRPLMLKPPVYVPAASVKVSPGRRVGTMLV